MSRLPRIIFSPIASTGATRQPAPISPRRSGRCSRRCRLPSSPRASMPSGTIMAIAKAISVTPWASARGNAQRSRRATWNPEIPVLLRAADRVASGRRFHFGIEVRDDVLECQDRLLNRGDLHQFPGTDRAVAILQGDNQIPPLLLELNKRQTVVRQMSHRGGSHPLDRTTARYTGVVLPLAYKSPANFNELAPAPAA